MEKEITIEERRTKDFLTGLLTRGFFINKLETLTSNGTREFTIFSIDLNKFKTINDVQGHHIGDIVLKEIGARLAALEDDDLLFARFGGDEFVGLYFSVDDAKIKEIACKIQETIKQRISYDKFEYEIGASIGIARFPKDSKSAEDLLKLADFAMYYAKTHNLPGHFVITEEFSRDLQQRNQIRSLLGTMDPERDLSLYFQPQFDVLTGKLSSIEAIVRWNSPDGGFIERDVFSPVAEEMGTIQYVTKWTFLRSIAQIKEWNEKYNTDLTMNIKVSQSCMYHRIFFSNLKYMLEAFAIKPSWLGIELNERTAMHIPDYTKELLQNIHELGVNISIADFGIGTICVGYIKQFYVNCLKIAPDIIRNAECGQSDLETLRGIIMLAQGMNLQTIANGVESKNQADILQNLGCDIVQGNFMGKIQSKEEFEKTFFS